MKFTVWLGIEYAMVFRELLRRIFLGAFCVFFLTACISQPIVEAQSVDTATSKKIVTQPFWFRGFLQEQTVDAAEICASPEHFVSAQKTNSFNALAAFSAQSFAIFVFVGHAAIEALESSNENPHPAGAEVTNVILVPVLFIGTVLLAFYAVPYTPLALEITCKS